MLRDLVIVRGFTLEYGEEAGSRWKIVTPVLSRTAHDLSCVHLFGTDDLRRFVSGVGNVPVSQLSVGSPRVVQSPCRTCVHDRSVNVTPFVCRRNWGRARDGGLVRAPVPLPQLAEGRDILERDTTGKSKRSQKRIGYPLARFKELVGRQIDSKQTVQWGSSDLRRRPK